MSRALRSLLLTSLCPMLLAASDASAGAAEPRREVRVPGYAFDPVLDGEPAIPAELRAGEGSRLRLVQLAGRPRDAWYRGLEAAGATIVHYLPHDTYLVWCDSTVAARLAQLQYVRWQGAFHPAYKLDAGVARRSGRIENAVAWVYSGGAPSTLGAEIELAAGAGAARSEKLSADDRFRSYEMAMSSVDLVSLASDERVIWIGFRPPEKQLDDEVSDQIVAGNYTGNTVTTGYEAHLTALGLDGAGVTWAISDTGVDWDHPDLAGRLVGGLTPPGSSCDETGSGEPGSDCSDGGHGTHVAGITAGDATSGLVDANGFLYGLGVAPGASLFALNVFNSITLVDAVKQAALGGSIGSNNSWSSTGLAGVGYTLDARIEDVAVRDANLDTAGVAEPFIQIFSAGNSGSGSSTITEPKEAKNIVSVANSLNARGSNIDQMSSTSSRGPAIDGRTLPTVTAPGSSIASTRNDVGGVCATAIAGTSNLYAFCSGTSMASPHVAGSTILVVEQWRNEHAGATPSMAMVKALLVNGAVEMNHNPTTLAPVPNNVEGWGRVHLGNTLAPASPRAAYDQQTVLGDTGETWDLEVFAADLAQPMRITLAWSDAPGAAGANPALVNDLDLSVTQGAATYLGNVFTGGWSSTGGAADELNNLENVYIQSPGSGAVSILVSATAIAGDGVPLSGDATDQDFALVCSNCVFDLFRDGFESEDTSAWSATIP